MIFGDITNPACCSRARLHLRDERDRVRFVRHRRVGRQVRLRHHRGVPARRVTTNASAAWAALRVDHSDDGTNWTADKGNEGTTGTPSSTQFQLSVTTTRATVRSRCSTSMVAAGLEGPSALQPPARPATTVQFLGATAPTSLPTTTPSAV